MTRVELPFDSDFLYRTTATLPVEPMFLYKKTRTISFNKTPV